MNHVSSPARPRRLANLLDTALSLFVAQGIQATSTASIAKAAGVANGTLFHHFATKQALVDQLYLDAKTSLAQALTATPLTGTATDQLQQCWQRSLNWAKLHPRQLCLMQQLSHDPAYSMARHHALMLETMPFLAELLTDAQQQGMLAPVPLPLLLNFCHHHFLSTARLFVDQPELAIDPDYQHWAFQLLWQGLRPAET